MKEVLIINNEFKDSENLNNFLKSKNIESKLFSLDEAKKNNIPKSTLICSKQIIEKIGGKSNLLKVSRDLGSTNLIVLI